MDEINNGGPAFPTPSSYRYEGMTLRQYAAIKLRVPGSGTDWLDEMIRESLRDEIAGKAMQDLLSTVAIASAGQLATGSYAAADAMLKAREVK